MNKQKSGEKRMDENGKKKQLATRNYDQRIKELEVKCRCLDEILIQNSFMLNGIAVHLYNLDTKLNEKETRNNSIITS